MIIDAWGQHPTPRHSQDPIFASLRRWNKTETPTQELPVAATVAMLDQAGVDKMLISAWSAPRNTMISNDEVAGFVAAAPDRLVGVGSVDISSPMAAVAEVRRYLGGNYGPLYQCAYMIGGLQVEALMKEVLASGRMSLREFHDAVLQQNSMPIELIRAGLLDVPVCPHSKLEWRFYGELETHPLGR